MSIRDVRTSVLVAAAILCSPSALSGELFFLNVCCDTGGSGKYRIARFGADGLQNPPTPVIHANNIGAGISGVAWPSALKVGEEVWIYASRLGGSGWWDVGLWKSSDDGKTFSLYGATLTPDSTESAGVGPAQVFYDDSSPRPFKMIYLVRGTPVGTKLRLADSADGQTWARVGDVLTASEPFEAIGVSPSWVMKLDSGEWALYYHGYETFDKAHAVVATAASIGEQFTAKSVIYSPDGRQNPVSDGAKFTNFATVSGTVLLGQPHVLRATDSSTTEPVVPIRQIGTVVYFDRPLMASYTSATLASVIKSKVDPSYVERLADGTYAGFFTGYGQYPGVLSEYTQRFVSPTALGPWTPAKDGFAFQPWSPASLLSTENPTAIIPAP